MCQSGKFSVNFCNVKSVNSDLNCSKDYYAFLNEEEAEKRKQKRRR